VLECGISARSGRWKAVADLTLDKQILEVALKGKW